MRQKEPPLNSKGATRGLNGASTGITQKGEATGPQERRQEEDRGGGGGGGDGPEIDPIIRGLLVRLPKSRAYWPESDRKLWLQLLEGSFKLIYKEKPHPAEGKIYDHRGNDEAAN